MTLDYCFQTIRVKPVEAVMLKQSEIMEEEYPLLSVPMKTSQSSLLEGVPHHILADYLAPLAAAMHYFKSPRVGDILPSDYVSFSRSKKMLSTAGMLMIALAIVLAGFALMQWMVISDLKSGIGTLRSNLSRSNEELANFRKLDDKLKSLSKPLEIIKNNSSALNPAEALASLTLPNTQEYYIKGISIQNGAGFLNVQIDGDITASGFGAIQATFEWIVEQLGKIPGYSVSSSALDIKLKTFKIQARYNGVGKQGK
jgi:cell division protein FtsL